MSLSRDARYALRLLLRSPGFTLTAVLTLALGIGANSAMFSVVRSVLLEPLPYPQAERLVRLWATSDQPDSEPANVNPLDLRDLAAAAEGALDGVAGINNRRFVVTGGDGEPERLRGARVTASFFPLLGAETVLGRPFTADEDLPGGPSVAVISHRMWQQRFGGDPGVLSRAMEIDGTPHAVVGVVEAGFRTPGILAAEQPLLWVPLRIQDDMGRGGQWLQGVARLAPGVGLDGARGELTGIASALEREHPETNEGRGLWLQPLKESVVGDLGPALGLLLASVGLVLLIACVNVANLLLARSAARRQEITVRTALGADRGRTVRQLLTESLLLAGAGGLLGLGLAAVLLRLLRALGPADLPRLDEIQLDATVLLFTLAVSMLTAVLFGLLPALRSSRVELRSALAEGGRSDAAGGGRRLSLGLLVVEMALSLVLLIGAGLLLRSFVELLDVDLGFAPANLLTAELDLPESGYPEPAQALAFYDALLERSANLPGVEAAGAVDMPPFSGYYSCNSIGVPDGSVADVEERVPCAEYRIVSPDYFATLGIEVEDGRGFTAADQPGSQPVAVVNQALARQLWPDGRALGRQLTLYFEDTVDHAVVGVVGDVRHFGLDAEVVPEVYVSHRQHPSRWMTVVLRADGDPRALEPPLRATLRQLDPRLPVSNVGTLEGRIADSVSSPRLRTLLLTGFALLALFLAGVGTFGVVAYSVARRTREIGLRMALGAGRGDILRLVVGQSMAAALAGVLLGLLAAAGGTRLLANLLYGVTVYDPLVFAVSPLVLVAVTLLASWLPARRASRVDPQVALRDS